MAWRVWITNDPPGALSGAEAAAAAAVGITEIWHGIPLSRRSTIPDGTLGAYEIVLPPELPAETPPDDGPPPS